ncbi:UNVERIFIED_ORG: hypothetical protein GGD48_004135 [Rhizobium etli]
MFETFLAGAFCAVLGMALFKHWMQRHNEHKARLQRMWEDGYNSDGTRRL